MVKLLTKIKASTLVETMVAMTIISLVSGFSMMIFLSVNTPSSSMASLLKAQNLSAQMADSTNQNYSSFKKGLALEIERENLMLKRFITQRNESLYELMIKVTDNDGRLIYTRKRLIYANL